MTMTYEEALGLVLSGAERVRTGHERMTLDGCAGRVLAEDVFSDVDIPPFDTSAMDGYACRARDLAAGRPRIIATVQAGASGLTSLSDGECVKIMTGARVPAGADTVAVLEETSETEEGTLVFSGTTGISNILRRGEDVKAGEKILSAGTRLFARHIATLASTGNHEPLVYEKPRVGVVSTGNELVPPSKKPEGTEIRNSNSSQILAQLKASGAAGSFVGIARDTLDDIEDRLRRSFASCDVTILSGGVSVSEFDLVPGALGRLGVQPVFHGVAIKPGKPVYFGKTTGGGRPHFVFGLPGKPVSSFVVFEILVKPFLQKMSGMSPLPGRLRLPLAGGFVRKSGARMEFIPARMRDGGVMPVQFHGSSHFHALSNADVLLVVPKEVTAVAPDSLVEVLLLD
ncbi:MAG: hypothetical protein A2583_08700 [Bdellovibrionales bacterium RIFOXYD1_FULL_53_11]|nr:MAG: hypothetical protein A2583_08700 [Bdellovibrionales bacterium RIFOXYD1_FULL_53_11]